ncbi:MAG: hypothetical protein K6G36_00965 [Candidatus Saccharibacteria bacterium]|nr:hypothetical protein [Candidatus Saccharibacteria bacterium]
MHFSDVERKLVNDLTSHGLRNSEILMFARTFKKDLGSWKYFIGIMMKNGVLAPEFDVNKVVTEEGVWSLINTLTDVRLIKNFGEATKELDWFLVNFSEDSEICQYREDLKGLWHFLLRNSVRFFRYKKPAFDATRFNELYDKFTGISEDTKHAVRAYLESKIKNPVIIGTLYGDLYGREVSDEKDRDKMKKEVAKYVDDVLKILLSDLIDNGTFGCKFWEMI